MPRRSLTCPSTPKCPQAENRELRIKLVAAEEAALAAQLRLQMTAFDAASAQNAVRRAEQLEAQLSALCEAALAEQHDTVITMELQRAMQESSAAQRRVSSGVCRCVGGGSHALGSCSPPARLTASHPSCRAARARTRLAP